MKGLNVRNAIEAIRNTVYMLSHDIEAFEHDMHQLFTVYDKFGIEELGEIQCWKSEYFNKLIMPVLCVYLIHKQHGPEEALKYTHAILADDWKLACEDWLTNRMAASK